MIMYTMAATVSLCILLNLALSQTIVTSYAPPKVVIGNLSIPGTISTNSPISITLDLSNAGAFSTGNLTLDIAIRGPVSYNDRYPISPLGPAQNESVVLMMNNRSTIPGEYAATIYVAYTFNNTIFRSNMQNTNYFVIPQSAQSGSHGFIGSANGIAFTYVPVYTSLFAGKDFVSEMGIKNAADSKVKVNMSIGGNYSDLLQLSAQSAYILPNQTAYIQLLFKSNSTPEHRSQTSTYYIPFNIALAFLNGSKANITEYITLSILNRTASQLPDLLSQIVLNSTNSTTGTIVIQGGSSDIENATLLTQIPASAATNSSQITTYGLNANVTTAEGRYNIIWQVPYVPVGQTIYAYYAIKGVRDTQFPLRTQSMLSTVSPQRAADVLKITNLSLPTLYVNSTGRIGVDALYTGIKPQTIYFYLTAPPGIILYNSTQSSNATPNHFISKNFGIVTNRNTGTLILTLYVNTAGSNVTYSIPMVVLPQQSGIGILPPATQVNAAQPGIQINTTEVAQYAEIAGVVILTILIVYGVILLINRPYYRPERANRLMGIKNQIKGENGI